MSLVLIVDDEVAISDLLKDILEDEGFTVELAADGQQALDMIHQHPPSLIVSDIMMPRLDGLSLCRKVKENPVTEHIPVILMTAAQIGESRAAGAADVLHKPFDIDELLSTVEQHTESDEDRNSSP